MDDDQRTSGWLKLLSKSIGPLRLELELVAAADRSGPGLTLEQLGGLFLEGDRLRIALALVPSRKLEDVPAEIPLTEGDDMAKKRLSDVIREECLRDGDHAYAAFADAATLRTKYPKVYDAIEAEGELRSMSVGDVLEKIARPFVDAELGKVGTPRENDGEDSGDGPAAQRE